MVGRWLEARGATADEVADVALAVGELVSNVAIHAYPMVEGRVVVNVALDGDMVRVDVSDTGSWRPPHDRGGGRGLGIVRAVVADVDVATTAAGTTVRFTRELDALRTVAVVNPAGSSEAATFGSATVRLGRPPLLVARIDGEIDIANAHDISGSSPAHAARTWTGSRSISRQRRTSTAPVWRRWSAWPSDSRRCACRSVSWPHRAPPPTG